MNIRKLMYYLLKLGLVLCLAKTALGGDKRGDQRSYYQYPPSKTLEPGTMWSPIITEMSDGSVYKSYYRLPNSTTTPQNSPWNPLISTKVKGAK